MDIQKARELLNKNAEFKQAYSKLDLSYEIGKMIIDARIARGLTQADLAQLIGTKQPSIARIESGNSLPSITFLAKVAEALGTQLLPPRLEFLEASKITTQNVKDIRNTWSFPPVSIAELFFGSTPSEATTVNGAIG
ncbi:MAG: putative transcriptional regulator [Patescibacteria group bacterium]|nr:putative transcriptional regulator [Patescibacteria group bacterium]